MRLALIILVALSGCGSAGEELAACKVAAEQAYPMQAAVDLSGVGYDPTQADRGRVTRLCMQASGYRFPTCELQGEGYTYSDPEREDCYSRRMPWQTLDAER